MNLWEEGCHDHLVDDTEACAWAQEVRVAQHKDNEETTVWRYHGTVLLRKLWRAVWQTMLREKGGVLFPDNDCTKTGRPILEVL